jgi:hypothetical protein
MQEESSSVPASATQPRVTIAALLIVIVAVAAYAFHERNVSKQLVERNSTVTSALNATQDQINALNAKLNAINAERAADKPAPTYSGVYRTPMNGATTRAGRKCRDNWTTRPSRSTQLVTI